MAEECTAGAGAGFAETTVSKPRRLNYLAWFVPYGFVAAGLLSFGLPNFWTRGADAHLAVLFVYMSLCCSFLPLPTTPIVCLAAAPAGAFLSMPHWLVRFLGVTPIGFGVSPLVVATVCTLATCVANLHDYYLLTYLYRYGRVQKVRHTKVYAWLSRFFRWSPLATLAAASCVPIPVDVVRLTAISEGYSRWKFVLASAAGRWPRYFLLAWLADRFSFGWQAILAILAVTVVLGLAKFLPGAITRFRHKEQST
jgi:membrane protein YqaA with SNARE-associated domain